MDFKRQLGKQLRFLEASCQAYDLGNVDEAIRIAVSVRVLVHDTNMSVSVLEHLRVKSGRMLSTATQGKKGGVCPWGALTNCRLVAMRSIEHFPPLATCRRKELVTFDTWWNKEPIFQLASGHRMSRRALVLGAANKDGGAHVDTQYDADYNELIHGHGLEMIVHPEGAASFTLRMTGGHLSAIRQIGYEVLHTPFIARFAGKIVKIVRRRL